MKLFFYEARKTYIRKYIVIFLLLLTFIDIFKIYIDYRQGDIDPLLMETEENQNAVKEIYDNLRSKSEQERAEYINEEEKRLGEIYFKHLNNHKKGEKTYSGNLYEDYRLLEVYIVKQYRHMQEYAQYSNDIESLAQDNVSYYKDVNNASMVKFNQYIVQQYKNRAIHNFCRMDTAQGYIEYNFSAFLILILSLLAFAPVFGVEYESGMQNIIITTRHMRKNLIMKMLCAIFFCICIVTWFFIVDYFSFRFICGVDGLNMPIWSIMEMKKSFLNCSVGYFVFIKYGMELLGFLTIMFMLLFLSSILRKPVYITFVFAMIIFLSYLLFGLIDSVSPIEKIVSVCNPISLISVSKLYQKLYYIKSGEGFILASNLALVANAIMLIILGMAIILMQRRKSSK